MKILSHIKSLKISIFVTLFSASLLGCQSTAQEEQVEAKQCQPSDSTTCEGDDRGFNPCRINDKLPVCKK